MDSEEIHVLNRRVRLLQPKEGFRTSLDSVMLAAACPARPGESILDLGSGVGGAGLCTLWRVADTTLAGVEIQPDHVELARRNAALNGMEARAVFACGDVRTFRGDPFDHVICNPPYMEAGTHTPSPSEKKARAHGHEETTLADWLEGAFRNLASGGSLTMIHRADRTDRILQGLERFGAVEIIPLWPRAAQPAKRVIIRALKDRRSGAALHPGIALHETDGSYTPEAENILRGGAAIL